MRNKVYRGLDLRTYKTFMLLLLLHVLWRDRNNNEVNYAEKFSHLGDVIVSEQRVRKINNISAGRAVAFGAEKPR